MGASPCVRGASNGSARQAPLEAAGLAIQDPAIPLAAVERALEQGLLRAPALLRCLTSTDGFDHSDNIIRPLARPPIIIGHSFGGLYTQLLLDRGLAAAGVVMGTGAPKGVLRLPFSTLRAAWPALGNPANLKKEAPLTPKQFHWCFTNAL